MGHQIGELSLVKVQARRHHKTFATVDLHCQPGSVVGLLGPNGVGKSTFLNALAQTGVDYSGQATYAGRELRQISARHRARLLALLPQDNGAPAELRVSELVAVGALAGAGTERQVTGEYLDVRVQRALSAVGINDLSGRSIGTLSGGELQLTQLARVLAQDTPLVLLDEPTAALDLGHQVTFESTVKQLSIQGKIVIVALHDLSLALNICDQVVLFGPNEAHVGKPAAVLQPSLVHQIYGVHTAVNATASGRNYLSIEGSHHSLSAIPRSSPGWTEWQATPGTAHVKETVSE